MAFQNECVNSIILDFLSNPDATPDSSCLVELAPLAYVPPEAIPLPVLADVNQLRTRVLVAFGVAAVLLLVVLSPFLLWPIVAIVRAFGEKGEARSADDRRLRWLGRGLLLTFGVLAAVFGLGMLYFLIQLLADLTLATALVLPAAAAPLLWLPVVLLLVAVAAAASLLTAAVMGSGQADMDPLQRAVAHTAPPTSGPGTPMPLDSTMPDAGSPSPAADLPVQEPAPTF